MKKAVLRIAAFAVILALIITVLVSTLVIYANSNIDYELDEKLFRAAKDSNTTTYLAYDNSGELVEVFKHSNGGAKSWVSLASLPDALVRGFVAVEDREFYRHNGINLRRTVGAMANQLLHFSSEFGASTITQQVIKNISGDNDRTVKRKLLELMRALHLEMAHSKEEILELYLNVIPMPENKYGIKEGASSLFGKEPGDLSVAECATLIGITNAPTRYNPRLNYDACLEKRNTVLAVMLDVGVIGEDEYQDAVSSPISLIEDTKDRSGVYSWFVETAREDIITDLCDNYGLSRAASTILLSSGTRVILTVNTEIQAILEDFFENTENLSPEVENGLEYSMVITDNSSGNLLGIIGRAGKKEGNLLLNLATSKHPPASTLKPLALFAPLIDKGVISWSTLFDDVPKRTAEDGDELLLYPHNSPDIYDGRITLYDAVIRSKNTVAVELAEYIGYEEIFRHLEEAYGFDLVDEREYDGKTVTDKALSPLALGQLTDGVSLRELTQAYTAFSNNGVLCKGRSYYGVFTNNGDVLLENTPSEKRIYKKSTAEIMNMLLSGVCEEGTAKSITLKYTVDTAGKTGTSSRDKDRLFIGYTPYCTAGIWTGYESGEYSVGSQDPSHIKIWDTVMQKVTNRLSSTDSEQLPGFSSSEIKQYMYCKKTGMLANDICELSGDAELGYFAVLDKPKAYCELHGE